jgi:hypothetical protein
LASPCENGLFHVILLKGKRGWKMGKKGIQKRKRKIAVSLTILE